LREILPGEEITCNYFDYDADTAWKLGLVPRESPLGHADGGVAVASGAPGGSGETE